MILGANRMVPGVEGVAIVSVLQMEHLQQNVRAGRLLGKPTCHMVQTVRSSEILNGTAWENLVT